MNWNCGPCCKTDVDDCIRNVGRGRERRRTRDMPANARLTFSQIERRRRRQSVLSVENLQVEDVPADQKDEAVGECAVTDS